MTDTRGPLEPVPALDPQTYNCQLLPVLQLWLEPTADGVAFLPSSLRKSLFKVLMALPVQKVHLKETGFGRFAVTMAADPRETRENRELLTQVPHLT